MLNIQFFDLNVLFAFYQIELFMHHLVSCFLKLIYHFYPVRDEGIVLKDLGSKWEPSDRSGKWLKLKPDYIRAGSDLDVLIIGL